MALSEVQWAWRLLGIAFYGLSAALVAMFLLRYSARTIPVLSAVSRWSESVLSRFSLRHAILASGVVVGVMTVLHWFTLQDPTVNNYGDFWLFWYKPAQAALNGQNPYATAPGVPLDWSSSINFGILFVALNALGLVVGNAYGIIVVYSVFTFLMPLAVFFLAREYLDDRRLQAYATLLAILIPQSLWYMERLVQDEPITIVAIVGSLVLVKRDKLWHAALLAGTLSNVKYAPMIFLTAFLIIHYKQAALGLVPAERRRLLLQHLAPYVGGVAIFALGMGLGYFLYGQDFLTRSFGMTSLLSGIETLTLLQSFRDLITPATMNGALVAALAALMLYLFLRKPRADPERESYLVASLVILVLLSVLFAKVNAEYVGLMMGLGLVYFARRYHDEAATLAVPRELGAFPRAKRARAVLYSPALMLALSALSDAYIFNSEYYRTSADPYPIAFQLVFTGVFLLLAVELLPRLRGFAARTPSAAPA